MQTLAAEILTAWRRAERLENEYPDGSPERAAATAACARLRDLYQELVATGLVAEMGDREVRERIAGALEDAKAG